MEFVRQISKLTMDDTRIAGGKGASLGELTRIGIPVPEGFVILSTSYDYFVKKNNIQLKIDSILQKVNHGDIKSIENASSEIKSLIMKSEIPKEISRLILERFNLLNAKYVAIRSSATLEDSPTASWAGQLETYLNATKKDLLENVKGCWASLFSPRAIAYRIEKNLYKENVSVAVVVQKMINSDESGIAFSVNPITKNSAQIVIEAGRGLGEAIVSGQITPDSYFVEKEPLKIINKVVFKQAKGLFRKRGGGNEWRELGEKANQQVLTDKEIVELSEIILKIEKYSHFLCDVEWAREKGEFYIVQNRPITTLRDNCKK